MEEIYIGCDPGNGGAIAILEKKEDPIIYDMPIFIDDSGKKKKKYYDINKLLDLLRPYQKKRVVFCLEDVHVQPGEGSVSAFSFGRGIGQLQGISIALGFELVMINPRVWKKGFPELESSEIEEFREQASALRKEIKEIRAESKNTKDKDIKNANKNKLKSKKKELAKVGRQLKKQAKENARILVQDKFPKIKDKFKLVKHDGRAEAVLIGLYQRDRS
jgi:hypothetical protein